MNKFVLLLCFFTQILIAQNTEIPVILYATSQDMLLEKAMDVQAIAVVKQQSTTHFHVKKIVDASTGKRLRGNAPWALAYNGDKYFHLTYSDDLNQPNVFVKMEIVGKYCAAFIDDGSPEIVRNGGTTYALGVAGVLITESAKWNKNWETRYGFKRKILFMDTTKKTSSGEVAVTPGNFLSRKQVREFLEEHYPGREGDQLDFDSVAALIRTLNAK